MSVSKPRMARATQRVLNDVTASPLLPAMFPALALGGFWLGGEPVLALLAIGVPLVWLAVLIGRSGLPATRTDPVTGLRLKEGFAERLEALLADCRSTGRTTVCFMIEVDDAPN